MLARTLSRSARVAPRGARAMSSIEWFPKIGKIPYDPTSRNPLVFKHYNAEEVIAGKTMREHLRFAVCYWHTFRGMGMDPFGAPTIERPWDDNSNSMENALRRVDAAFEFLTKLGVEYYTFHDVDVAPLGRDFAEHCANLDQVAEYLQKKQKATGVKLLWGTANLFSHPRYMNGAGTNPNFHSFAFAGAQVKKMMEVTYKLGGENYVFWGGREGYQSVLNTNMKRELDHFAAFLRMAVDHKQGIGAKYQLLIEPKPREPTKHQYDYDAQTVMGFLNHYKLQDHFKLNIEPNHTTLAGHSFEHDIMVASQYRMLGSIDSNTGDELLGWDTDQFPMSLKQTALVMHYVLEQGGLGSGGLNFDCKVRRESTDLEDMFLGHVGAMDTFARGLRVAVQLRQEGVLPKMLADRYASWDTGLGKDVESGKKVSFADLEKYVKSHGEAPKISGKQEKFEVVFNDLLLPRGGK